MHSEEEEDARFLKEDVCARRDDHQALLAMLGHLQHILDQDAAQAFGTLDFGVRTVLRRAIDRDVEWLRLFSGEAHWPSVAELCCRRAALDRLRSKVTSRVVGRACLPRAVPAASSECDHRFSEPSWGVRLPASVEEVLVMRMEVSAEVAASSSGSEVSDVEVPASSGSAWVAPARVQRLAQVPANADRRAQVPLAPRRADRVVDATRRRQIFGKALSLFARARRARTVLMMATGTCRVYSAVRDRGPWPVKLI